MHQISSAAPWGSHPDTDLINSQRSETHFAQCPIPDIVKLGRVHLLEASKPLKLHTHPDCFEICFHDKGTQEYIIEKETFETRSNHVFLTFPNEKHGSGSFPEEKTRFFYLIFHCMPDTQHFMGLSAADSDWIRDTLWSCSKRVFPGKPEMRLILEEILQIYFQKEPLQEARIKALFIRFFYLLCSSVLSQSCEREETIPRDIAQVAAYIDAHPGETCSAEELAKSIHLSASQFKRKFKKYMDIPPHDYIIRQKIQSAREMMQYTFLSITEIANELGFSSSQHFASVFRKYTGMSPSEYRESLRRPKSDPCTDS